MKNSSAARMQQWGNGNKEIPSYKILLSIDAGSCLTEKYFILDFVLFAIGVWRHSDWYLDKKNILAGIKLVVTIIIKTTIGSRRLKVKKVKQWGICSVPKVT